MYSGPIATFDGLPSLVKRRISGSLSGEDLVNLRQTCPDWTYFIRNTYGIRLIIHNSNSKYFLSECAYGPELKKVKFYNFTGFIPDEISFANTLTEVEFAFGITTSNVMRILNSFSAMEHLSFTKTMLMRPRTSEFNLDTFNPKAKLKSIRFQIDQHHKFDCSIVLDLLAGKFDLCELKEFKFDRGESGICQNMFTIAGCQRWTMDTTDIRILQVSAHDCKSIQKQIAKIVKRAAASKLEVLILDALWSLPEIFVLDSDPWTCPNLKELSITILELSGWPELLSAPMFLTVFRVEVLAECLGVVEVSLMNWCGTLQELKLVVYYPGDTGVHVQKEFDYFHMFQNLKVLHIELPRVRKTISTLPKKLEKFLIDTPVWSAEVLNIIERSPELTDICLKNIGMCMYSMFHLTANVTPPVFSLQFFQEFLRAPKIKKIVFLHTSALDFELIKEYCCAHPGLEWKDESASFLGELLVENLCNAEISVHPEFDRKSI